MGCFVLCVCDVFVLVSSFHQQNHAFTRQVKKGGVVVILKMTQNEFPHRLVGRGCNANTDNAHNAR